MQRQRQRLSVAAPREVEGPGTTSREETAPGTFEVTMVLILIFGFLDSITVREDISVVLSHQGYGSV